MARNKDFSKVIQSNNRLNLVNVVLNHEGDGLYLGARCGPPENDNFDMKVAVLEHLPLSRSSEYNGDCL